MATVPVPVPDGSRYIWLAMSWTWGTAAASTLASITLPINGEGSPGGA